MNFFVFSDDFVYRIHAGLLELQGKHGNPVIREIEAQLKAAGTREWADKLTAAIAESVNPGDGQ